MKRTLNVKKTSNSELFKKWDLTIVLAGELFVICNSKGVIKWKTTSVYNLSQLLKRGNFKIID